jgi:hypothetical protein
MPAGTVSARGGVGAGVEGRRLVLVRVGDGAGAADRLDPVRGDAAGEGDFLELGGEGLVLLDREVSGLGVEASMAAIQDGSLTRRSDGEGEAGREGSAVETGFGSEGAAVESGFGSEGAAVESGFGSEVFAVESGVGSDSSGRAVGWRYWCTGGTVPGLENATAARMTAVTAAALAAPVVRGVLQRRLGSESSVRRTRTHIRACEGSYRPASSLRNMRSRSARSGSSAAAVSFNRTAARSGRMPMARSS